MTDEQMRRPRRKELTDKMVAGLPRKRKRYIVADPELRGHYVRVPPHGPFVFAAVARYRGRQVWATLGTADVLEIEEARDKAREAIRRIKKGLPAFEPPPVKPDSFAAVAEGWLTRHVAAKGLRTGDEMKRVLGKYVLPHWRDRPFAEIRRSDIAPLLDTSRTSTATGSPTACCRCCARCRAGLPPQRRLCPPFVNRMRRTPQQARKRNRILNDDELRTVWQRPKGRALRRLLQVLLLTGQRRDKVATMSCRTFDDGTWTIPTAAAREGQPRHVAAAAAGHEDHQGAAAPFRQPVCLSRPQQGGPLSGFSSRHAAFKASCGVDGFYVARSPTHRAQPVVPHQCAAGHWRAGFGPCRRRHVEQTYDVHDYCDEMADALKRLARLIESIVHRRPDKRRGSAAGTAVKKRKRPYKPSQPPSEARSPRSTRC